MIKGKKMPYICIPLVSRTKEAIILELQTILPKSPDLIEWRADFFENIDEIHKVISTAQEICELSNLPVLFTIRSEKEGGEKIPLGADEIVELLSQICRETSVEFIDFEVSNEPEHIKQLRQTSLENGKKLILSYHNFDKTPENRLIIKKLIQAELYGADIAKAAVMPKNKEDVLRLLEVTKEADLTLDIPIITMSMGGLGGLSRMIGWTYGSIITFGMGAESSAPGQISIEKLHDFIKSTQDILSEW